MRRTCTLSIIASFVIHACITSTVQAWQNAKDAPVPQRQIRALLITGHNNHNWQFTSRVHKDTLEATGRFVVDITDAPEERLNSAATLKRYQVFILDYNDFGNPKRWGETAEKNFIDAVRSGTGVVAIHSANNAFDGWKEYEEMLALMWRKGTGHGSFHRFDVAVVDQEHPITRSIPDLKAHPDELYHDLVNVHNVEFHVLAHAHASKESGGTGENEPMAITLNYGKGRVFATPLGHVWNNADDTKPSICDPQFKIFLARGAEWAATGSVTLGTTWQDLREHNRLTPEEESQGWRLLFNGTQADAFRGYRQEGFPQHGWAIENGTLIHQANGKGGDIITVDQFADFEFSCEWRIASGGNSGIFYRCSEEHQYPWQTGPEMQILDDAIHADGKNKKTRAGTMYGLLECAHDVARPPSEWNHMRIVAKGSKIEHWLNGFKVVDVDLDSDEFRQLVAASKFATMPDFIKPRMGHIALQDHGDEVAFRNIKIRTLQSEQ